jgi:hypothetical protein
MVMNDELEKLYNLVTVTYFAVYLLRERPARQGLMTIASEKRILYMALMKCVYKTGRCGDGAV